MLGIILDRSDFELNFHRKDFFSSMLRINVFLCGAIRANEKVNMNIIQSIVEIEIDSASSRDKTYIQRSY